MKLSQHPFEATDEKPKECSKCGRRRYISGVPTHKGDAPNAG